MEASTSRIQEWMTSQRPFSSCTGGCGGTGAGFKPGAVSISSGSCQIRLYETILSLPQFSWRAVWSKINPHETQTCFVCCYLRSHSWYSVRAAGRNAGLPCRSSRKSRETAAHPYGKRAGSGRNDASSANRVVPGRGQNVSRDVSNALLLPLRPFPWPHQPALLF